MHRPVNHSTEVLSSVESYAYEIVNNPHNKASTLLHFMQKRGSPLHVGMCIISPDGTVMVHGFRRRKKKGK